MREYTHTMAAFELKLHDQIIQIMMMSPISINIVSRQQVYDTLQY